MPQDGAAPVLDGPAAAVFAVPHGMGHGILTIAKRSLPLAVFGPVGFGAWQGLLVAPARLPQAAAPFAFGLLVETSGAAAALMPTCGLSVAAGRALLAICPVAPAGKTAGTG